MLNEEKRGMLKAIFFILVFLLVSKLDVVNAVRCECGVEADGSCTLCPQEQPSSEETEQQITKNIEDAISTGESVDFSDSLYKDNPDIVKDIIKDKYNLDLDNIEGLRIDGNTLTTSDGSQIDLNTGKPLTVETDGSKVTYFDDGAGTTCVNCEGLTYTPDGFSVSAGEQIDYSGSSSTMAQNYDAQKGTFSVASADAVIIAFNVFNKVKDSQFSVIANYLRYADVTCNKDNNTAILLNPVEGSSSYVEVDCDKDDSFEVTVLDSQINFVLDEGVFLNLTKITFLATETNAKFSITAGEPPKYGVSRGILNFIVEDFIEVIEAECVLSSTEIDYSRGFKQIILSPFINILCPGARYSQIDRKDKEKSFSILNTGKENYLVGFYKNGLLPYDVFAKTLLGNSWGYVDYPERIELNGIASYERFREFIPEIESLAAYDTAELEFMPVYSSFDYWNKAKLSLVDGKNAELTVANLNVDEKTDVIVEVNSAIHKIIEKQISGNIFRFENFNRQPQYPPYITEYSSNFKKETPIINILEGIFTQTCIDGPEFIIYTPGTDAINELDKKLQSWSATAETVEYFATLPRS